jgi:acetyl-CoA acetyltransferase
LWEAAAQSAIAALDAVPGLRESIDAVFVSGVISSSSDSADMTFSRLPAELGLTHIKNNEQVFAGGATGTSMLRHSCALVQSGLARAVLCVYSDRLGSGLKLQDTIDVFGTLGIPHYWEGRLGQYFNVMAALMTSAYIHQTGCSEEDLAAVVASCSQWAQHNPHAMLRNVVSAADVMGSRYVADPIKMLELSRFADGSAAMIITSADLARTVTPVAVGVRAIGSDWGHYGISFDPNFPRLSFRTAGERAFKQAGLQPKDIDIAEIYDTYPVFCMIQLEDLGFCKTGAAGPFVASGATAPGGVLPMTTNGGMLRKGHTGPGGGFDLIVELFRQLTWQAGPRQAGEPKLGLVTGSGGSYMNADVAILSREEV